MARDGPGTPAQSAQNRPRTLQRVNKAPHPAYRRHPLAAAFGAAFMTCGGVPRTRTRLVMFRLITVEGTVPVTG